MTQNLTCLTSRRRSHEQPQKLSCQLSLPMT